MKYEEGRARACLTLSLFLVRCVGPESDHARLGHRNGMRINADQAIDPDEIRENPFNLCHPWPINFVTALVFCTNLLRAELVMAYTGLVPSAFS
jgi:hypothetical protein